MRQEFKQLVLSHYVTSSPVKQKLLEKNGYSTVRKPELWQAIGNAEANQSLFIEDNNPEKPVVLDIARRKAEGLLGHSQLVATFGGQLVPLVVNDTVWNFATNQQGGRVRTIINKPTATDDVHKLRKFYTDAEGSMVYSSAGLCVVVPDPFNPIPYSLLTKLRLGRWIGGVPNDFIPNTNYAFGMDSVTALRQGYIEPHPEMKFEVISFKDTERLRTQSNFSTRIPFRQDSEHLELIHALGSGIINRETLSQLQKPSRVQRYRI